ncbi:MAG: phosphomethylpyrimidine synthase, partial [Acidimicrobiaceae bacterium]|nr:phosphomethylpyrimidine synthase [Acidimicrobiaceae bacterium]
MTQTLPSETVVTPAAPTAGTTRKVYLHGGRPDLLVPFREIHLHDSPGAKANEPIRLYDTSGPGSEPAVGLPAHRLGWIEARGDTELAKERPATLRDDGRAAVRAGATGVAFEG